MVGAAGWEVRRSPRGGAAGLEPRRITGEGRGRDRKFAGGQKRGSGGSSLNWFEGARECRVGGEESEARALLRAPGCPARPPRAEPTAARGLLELSRPRARALYRAPERGSGGAGLPRGGDRRLTPPGSPGNAARRPADVRRLPGLPLAAANFFPLGEGAERPRGGAGRWGARGGVESSAQMGAAGWRREGTAPLLWGCTVGNPQHI